MKRMFLSMSVLCLCMFANAQITTYSSCDTNTDGVVNVEDVTNTTNKVLAKSASETNVVTAEQLNEILNGINEKLDEHKSECKCQDNAKEIAILKQCLSSIATKLGATTPEEIEESMKYNGHEYVDLGLSVKWATCNIGATNPEDYGLYFAWGETTGYTNYIVEGRIFNWENYKWCNGSEKNITKYCTSSDDSTGDGMTILEPSDDAACANWGGLWRMPTDNEMTELRENCTWTWTQKNGFNGYKITGNNGNSIFLPAAGCLQDTYITDPGQRGRYWTSTIYISCSAYCITFDSDAYHRNWMYRSDGYTVRPVIE